MSIVRRTLPGLVATVALAGCAQAPVPRDHFYRILLPEPTVRVSVPLDGPLTVRRLSADGLTGERALVYSVSGRAEAPKHYRYHLWTDPPGRMMQEQLAGYLAGAGVAPQVVTPDVRLGASHVLTGRIKRFEQVLGERPGVIVSLQFALSRRGDGELLMLRSYEVEKTTQSEDVASAVRAMGDALAEVAAGLAADIAAR